MTLGSALRRLNNAVDPTPMPRSAHSARINTHNMFLQIGLQTGVAGILAFGLLCASLLFGPRAREGAPVDRTRRFVAACTVAVLVHSTFEALLLTRTLVVSLFPWMLLGIGMGVVNARRGVPGRAR